MRKLVIITTVPLSLATLIKGQPKYLSQFFNVSLVTSDEPINAQIEAYEGVKVYPINMSRQITPLADLKSLFKIYLYFLKSKPDIVYSFTPKAGLLAMIASFFARVPFRVHNIVGMPLMEASGAKKKLLRLIEQTTYLFATELFCNSFGLQKYIKENLTDKEVTVIGDGSINGIDGEFFQDTFLDSKKLALRANLNIKRDDFVLLFVGRVVRDKGINELIEAFAIVNKRYKNIKLIIVGDFEEHLNPIDKQSMELMKKSPNIIQTGFKKDIRPYLAIANLFVLPSYREGLPNSLLEAGSFGVPLMATDINGCNEIIINGKNGILVQKKSVNSLVKNIIRIIEDKDLYKILKNNVRISILKRYNQKSYLERLKYKLENLK
jgi:glycosyltransferase involved in cell wall biosynthesis